jgi:hypothetical protein
MNHTLKNLLLAAIGVSSLAAIALRADPVTVQEAGVGPAETVWIDSSTLGNSLHVYAGVLTLNVNGVATNGFCIDPWHWSDSSVQNYNTVVLGTAPKAPGPMGAAAATQIEQLWAQFYSSSMSNVNAAAMQIEIWNIVDAGVAGGTFHLDSIDGASTSTAVLAEITTMQNFLANNPNAVTADLIAVTGPGQDYVIPNVPDGGVTLCMLGLAFVGLVAFRKRFHSC